MWNISRSENGNAQTIAFTARSAGLSHVLVKIADGVRSFPYMQIDPTKPVVDVLKSAGIHVWGWQYVYGQHPEREADIAIRRCLELGVDGFVVNAEVEYKNRPGQAGHYMRRLRAGLRDLPIGLSSYRFPNLHREFPFNRFLEHCDLNLPQVYWMRATNSGAQLRESIRQFRQASLVQRPIIPTGAAFQEHGWRPTANQILEFMITAQQTCEGCNFWVWEHTRRHSDLWDVIRDYRWSISPAPEPTPTPAASQPQQTSEFSALRVVTDNLRVRSGPGIRYPVTGMLSAGDTVRGDEIWVRHERGWSAMRFDGVSHLV
jgi:hypothetical protein